MKGNDMELRNGEIVEITHHCPKCEADLTISEIYNYGKDENLECDVCESVFVGSEVKTLKTTYQLPVQSRKWV